MVDVDPKIIKRTQESLGKLIKKPPLTEKLLSRPPFRFLHDICTAFIKSTGFMKGLFTLEELQADNVKDKEAKIAFLQKLFDYLIVAHKKPLSAKISSVISGKEADKTNEFLQLLAEVVNKNINNEEVVQQVLNGEANNIVSVQKSKDLKLENKNKIEKPELPSSSDSKGGHSGTKTVKSNDSSTDKNKTKKPKPDEKVRKSAGNEKELDKQKDKKSEDLEKKSDKQIFDKHQRPEKDSVTPANKNQHITNENGMDSLKNNAINGNEHNTPKDNKQNGVSSNSTTEDDVSKVPRPLSAKGNRERTDERSPKNQLQSTNKEVLSQAHISSGRRPPSAHANPVHARRASNVVVDKAPRQIVINSNSIGSTVNNTPSVISGPTGRVSGVIIDRSGAKGHAGDEDDDNDDDDPFIVEETIGGGLPRMAGPTAQHLGDDDAGDEMHGVLVNKMLQSKKELESGNLVTLDKKGVVENGSRVQLLGGQSEEESLRRQERAAIEKEVTRVGQVLQALTRSALPLGKLMEFIQEDLDSMQQEYERWQAEELSLKGQLKIEASLTEASLVPLKQRLAEIDDTMNKNRQAIAEVKAKIVQNDERIQQMLTRVVMH